MAERGTIGPVDQGPLAGFASPNNQLRLPSAARSAMIYVALPLFAAVFAFATVGL